VSLRLYTLDEVADVCRVSLATVRYWVHSKRIESVRPGRRRMVTEAALAAFISRRKQRVQPQL
jgi:excisionase family DNA binding protein